MLVIFHSLCTCQASASCDAHSILRGLVPHFTSSYIFEHENLYISNSILLMLFNFLVVSDLFRKAEAKLVLNVRFIKAMLSTKQHLTIVSQTIESVCVVQGMFQLQNGSSQSNTNKIHSTSSNSFHQTQYNTIK